MERNPKLWNTRKGASILNEHHDEVIEAFRNRTPLAEIGSRYGMVATAVMNWLKKQGEYDRIVECELPECDETFPFRPRKRYCCRLHTKRANARERIERPGERQKARARLKLNYAVAIGKILRPTECERCGQQHEVASDGRSLIQADHHYGYGDEYHLEVWWLCKACDIEVEKLRKQGLTINRESPGDHIH